MEESRRLAPSLAVARYLDGVRAERWSVLAARFGASAVVTAREHRMIQSVLPGILASAEGAEEFLVRARALTLWSGPSGLITGLAAGHLWRIVDEPPACTTIQVPSAWHLKGPSWVKPLRIGAGSRRSLLRGAAVVPPADAVIQCWREARPDVAASTVIASIVRERCTQADLLDALAARKQVPRRAQLEDLIAVTRTAVTSYLEYVAWRDVFPPRLFPKLQWQVEVWPGGRMRVMDAFDPEAMIDLEFDGGGTHGGVAGFERDRRRDADMRAAGIEPLHHTYRDLTQRAKWCRQNYLELRAARLR